MLAIARPHHHHKPKPTIGYLTDRDATTPGVYNIWTLHAGHRKQITHATEVNAINGGPRYTLNGKKLGFNINPDGTGAGGIAIMNAGGSHRRTLIPDGNAYGPPSFGPGGKFVYPFYPPSESTIQVLLARADGTHVKQITHEPISVSSPALSPNGKRVVYSRSAEESQPSELFSIGIDGKHRKRLTHNSQNDDSPSFSPNGKLIAWLCTRTVGSNDYNYDLCLMNANGTHQRRVTKTTAYEQSPTFSPNSKLLTFSSAPGSPGKRAVDIDSDIYTIKLNGKGRKALTKDANVSEDQYPSFKP